MAPKDSGRNAQVRRVNDIKNTITFIYSDLPNDIDFLRRFSECLCCWVVGDIGAGLDPKTLNDLSQVASSDLRCCERVLPCPDQTLRGEIFLRPSLAMVKIISMSRPSEGMNFVFISAHRSKVGESASETG